MTANAFLKINIWYRLPVLALCAAIFWQSHSPCVMGPSVIPFADKIMHLGAYSVLGFLCVRWLDMEVSGRKKARIIIAGFVLASVFGLSDEFHQSFIISRTASVYDFIADCAGAALGGWIWMLILSGKSRKSENSC